MDSIAGCTAGLSSSVSPFGKNFRETYSGHPCHFTSILILFFVLLRAFGSFRVRTPSL